MRCTGLLSRTYSGLLGIPKICFFVYEGLNEELTVRYYTDTSFQTDRDDTQLQYGCIFTLSGGAIVWKSSKQSIIAISTAKSEYMVVSEATKEVGWIRKFIFDLRVVPSNEIPMEMHSNN